MMKQIRLFVAFLKFIFAAVCIVNVMFFLGVFQENDSCYSRYNLDPDKNNKYHINSSKVADTILLNANGYYDSTLDSKSPSSYGKWKKSNIFLSKDSNVVINIQGEVSLCKSYLTDNNLQNDKASINKDGNKVAVPRIGGAGTTIDEKPYVSLVFDVAKSGSNWRNVVGITPGDRLLLTIDKNKTESQVSFSDDLYSQYSTKVDCTLDTQQPIGKTSPLCGRYALYNPGICEFVRDPNPAPTNFLFKERMFDGYDFLPDKYYVRQTLDLQEICHIIAEDLSHSFDYPSCLPYKHNNIDGCACDYFYSDGHTSFSVDIYIEKYGYQPNSSKSAYAMVPYATEHEINIWPDTASISSCSACPIDKDKHEGGQAPCHTGLVDGSRIWFTADHMVGLRNRIADENNEGSNLEEILRILTTDPTIEKHRSDGRSPPYAIYNDTPQLAFGELSKKYFQLAFQEGAKQGGYIVNIQHTKCVRNNGTAFADSDSDGACRGQIKYLILPPKIDPNKFHTVFSAKNIVFNRDGDSGTIFVDASNPDEQDGGYLWFKVENKAEDYIDSSGTYILKIQYVLGSSDFLVNIINPLIGMIKSSVFKASELIMDHIINKKYINWLLAILTIYIIIMGLQFLLGMAKFNLNELIIRLIKVAFIVGFVNGYTIEFFHTTLFPIITESMDDIISNIAGYGANTEMFIYKSNGVETNVTAPFLFLNDIMTKIFFNKVFYIQLLSTFSMGLAGIPLFIAISYSIILLIYSVIEVISIYLVALMFIGLLIIVAPIFLVFMLFERTRYLFDNWVAYTVRYCLEPVLIIGGIIILLQLHEVYLDQVLSYSVCWKCVLPFKIPISAIKIPFISSSPMVTLFCINWFVPWGYETGISNIQISFYDVIAIVILAQCMLHYISFMSQAVGILFSGRGGTPGPSVSQYAMNASDYVKDKVKDEVKPVVKSLGDKIDSKLSGKADRKNPENPRS